MYADIIVDISRNELDRTFQYRVPETLAGEAVPGAPVLVPFGKGRTIRGTIVSLSETPKIPAEKIRDIGSIPKDAVRVEGQLIALAAWMADHYGSTMNQALKTVLPIKRKEAPKEKKTICLALSQEEAKQVYSDFVSRKRHSVAKERLMAALLKDPVIPWDIAVQKLSVPSTAIRDLEKSCFLRIISSRDYRNPLSGREQAAGETLTLNAEQRAALDTFLSDWNAGGRKKYLLYGVTGSGKTEVYIRMIERVLAEGKQAIVLIPEIALTYQTLMRFYSRFGEKVSVIHSRLSPGERSDQFERAERGEISIMIGPRSALFTPFPDPGIIIIDEEQEGAYKSETVPRYHARETAEKRAELAHAALVLGSATPSLEAMTKAESGVYTLLPLRHRAAAAALPQAIVVDMREELKAGNRSILSKALQQALSDRLERGEQAMLFLNRRGLMGFVSCRSCGHVLKCPHCDVSLSLHRDGRLHCHYCGYVQENVKRCPECGSSYIGTFKAGTEKVEEVLKQAYPAARILRMDADTTKGKNGHEAILSAFANREADILLGTQMIVKGHDFSAVTLMGILAADMSLNASDFRSGERTFDLLTQAAGRAGRGESPGQVIIQTYQPENYAVRTAAAQDYGAFYREEAAFRRLMAYPPFSHMLRIELVGEKKDALAAAAEELYGRLKAADGTLFIMKPQEGRLARLNDQYRMAIYIKDGDYERLVAAKDLASALFRDGPLAGARSVTVFFDFDPMGGF